MTEDHKALIERVAMSVAKAAAYTRAGCTPCAHNDPDDVKALLTLARRGAAAEGLVEALEEVRGCFSAARSEGLDECLAELDYNDVGSIYDLVTRRLMFAERAADKALSDYTAATQSTPSVTGAGYIQTLPGPAPISGLKEAGEALALTQSTEPSAGGFQGAALSTSTPGEAASVAEKLTRLTRAVIEARNTFARYVKLHAAKQPPDVVKAQANLNMMSKPNAVLAGVDVEWPVPAGRCPAQRMVGRHGASAGFAGVSMTLPPHPIPRPE